jgi:dihydroorotate dehydrogenase (NAD+) catalytic subunit
MLQPPFYNPNLSYEENFEQGPFGYFVDSNHISRSGKPQHRFLNHQVFLPFGIPAGPLVNANFVTAAFRKGFDICTYKTVRTRPVACHPFPNVVPVEVDGDLLPDVAEPLIAGQEYDEPLSITNSFGVPSKDPDWWQPDMRKAVQAAGEGQVLIGSFQGTKVDGGSIKDFVADFGLAARLTKETGAPILEANLSCPNEGTANLVCFDLERVVQIVEKIRQEIDNTPLILKMAYFPEDESLEAFVKAVGPLVNGLAAINTIPAAVLDHVGNQALPGEGRLISGVCGRAIQWAGVEMVNRLGHLRTKLDLEFAIMGVGGVVDVDDYRRYRDAGADAVQSATGAMWRPQLAEEIWEVMEMKK